MARTLASIQVVCSIDEIPEADSIEAIGVLGWKCVAKKNEFKMFERVVYCEIDSFLPIREEFEFLRKCCFRKYQDGTEGFRIKTIRLKKQLSQGIVFPLSILKGFGMTDSDISALEEGDEVTEKIGIVLYDPPVPVALRGIMRGNFPSFIPKTDEERVQNLSRSLERHRGEECYITEKIDGSSATFYVRDGEFHVCSRNIDIKDEGDNAFWNIAREYDLETKLKFIDKNIAIQGEFYGAGIQKNPLHINGNKLAFFNAYDIDKSQRFNFEDFKKLIAALHCETVPILNDNYVIDDPSPKCFVAMADGPSAINPKVGREGIVIRSKANTEYSFKAISNEMLLKEKE